MFTKILVATDGSGLSNKAVAVQLAKTVGAGIVGMTAVEAYPYAAFGQVSLAAFQAHAGVGPRLAHGRIVGDNPGDHRTLRATLPTARPLAVNCVRQGSLPRQTLMPA